MTKNLTFSRDLSWIVTPNDGLVAQVVFLEDGCAYLDIVKNGGVFTSANLRELADMLDEINKERMG